MSTVTGKPAVARRSERSRQAVLQATRELLSEVGYAGLTIEGIAARAGVGKQTVYRWWRSKGAVVFEAFLTSSEGAPGIAVPDTGDIEADLKSVVRATAAGFADPAADAPVRALMMEVIADPELAAEYREKLAGPADEALRERLRGAQRAGQITAGADLDLVLDLLQGPLRQRWLLRTGPVTAGYADAVVERVLEALRP